MNVSYAFDNVTSTANVLEFGVCYFANYFENFDLDLAFCEFCFHDLLF